MTLLLLAAAAFLASLVLTGALVSGRLPFAVLDHPNHRSLHVEPTPRGGGLAFGVAICFALGAFAWFGPGAGATVDWIMAGAVLVAAVSLADDRWRLHPGLRIPVHFAAATSLIGAGLVPGLIEFPGSALALPAWLGTLFALFYAVWLLNLYNFMDGMDGFAGGMAVIGFGTYAILGWQTGATAFAALNLIIAGAVGGFLVFNFPPARIFMGDVGASPLGFLAAALSLWATRDGLFPLWVGVLIFSPFIVDATVTLGRRLARRERVWEAHRSHYYQRLVRLGWGHRKTVLWEYLLMLACAASALAAVRLPAAGRWWLLCAWAIAYTVLMLWVGRLESRGKGDAARTTG